MPVRPVVVLTNSPAPYRELLWRELSTKLRSPFEVWYNARRAPGRQWTTDAGQSGYLARVFRFVGVSRKSREGGRRTFGIAPGVALRLLLRPPKVLVCGDAGWTSLTALLSATVRRVPLVVWTESISTGSGSRLRRRIFSLLSRRARSFVVPGARSRKLLTEYGTPENRIFVAPQSTDAEFWTDMATKLAGRRTALREEFGIRRDEGVVLYVGGLWMRKRVQDLCDAVGRLNSEGHKIRLWVVGGTSDAEHGLVERLTSGHDKNTVHMFGYAKPSTLARYYAAADCLALVSDYDPWGFVVNEAQYFGLPVITSTGVAAGDDLVDEHTGIVVDTGNITAIAEGITMCLKIGKDESAREKIRKKICGFSPERQAAAFADAIEHALVVR